MYRHAVHLDMIKTFRHRGLKRLYENGDISKLQATQVKRIEDVLNHLDGALKASEMDLPGYRLHPLKGALKNLWRVRISGNWRITFRFEDSDVFDVDLVDYH